MGYGGWIYSGFLLGPVTMGILGDHSSKAIGSAVLVVSSGGAEGAVPRLGVALPAGGSGQGCMGEIVSMW